MAVEDGPETDEVEQALDDGPASATRRIDSSVRAGFAVAGSSLTLLVWWVLRAPFVGLADNGDWDRYSCPLGLSGGVRFTRVPATLTPADCPAFDYRSSFTPFLWVFAKVDTALAGSVHLSHLAVFWSVVVAAGWGWFAFELARTTRRPWPAAGLVAVLVVVSSDVIFTSYFGSIYAEALVIALLPSLGAALVRVVRCEHLDVTTLVGTTLLLAVVSCSKPSMAFTAPIFLAIAAFARRGRVEPVRLGCAAIAAVGLTVFSIAAIPDPEFTDWNTYNLAFTAVLPASADPQAAMVDMGIPPAEARSLERFVGVPFGPEVTEAWDDAPLTAFRRAGRPAVLRALAKEPGAWGDMVEEAGTTLGDLRLTYLANHTGPDDASTPSLAHRPHPADAVLDVVAAAWWLLPIAWLVAIAWLSHRLWGLRRGDGSAAATTALALLAVALASNQVLTALGDGYYELAKHLAIAGELTALVSVGLAVAAADSILRRARAARRHRRLPLDA
jgi:hypothetical protein